MSNEKAEDRIKFFEEKIKTLIDNLKSICAAYGLGNDGNEFKIITQVFLYKFMNDKFTYEVKNIDTNLKTVDSWEKALRSYSDNEYEMLLLQLGPDTARLRQDHFISYFIFNWIFKIHILQDHFHFH